MFAPLKGQRAENLTVDEISPRRPGDPPWRSRTAHRTSDPDAMAALRTARLRHGWTMTRAAEETGVSRPHLSLVERGLRRPSVSVAEALIGGLRMSGEEADAVRSIALEHVGRDSPFRTGDSPPRDGPETSWETQDNETHHSEGAEQHRADSGTDGATGRAAPAASAEDWIAWAKRKAEEAEHAQRTAGTS